MLREICPCRAESDSRPCEVAAAICLLSDSYAHFQQWCVGKGQKSRFIGGSLTLGGAGLAASDIDGRSFNGDVKMSEMLLLGQSSGNGVFVFGGAIFIVLMLFLLAASIFWIWM